MITSPTLPTRRMPAIAFTSSDSSPLSAEWSVIGAGGTQDPTLVSAEAALDQKFGKT